MAAATDVEICNMALDHIGKKEIIALSETGVEATLCRRHYDPARRAALSKSNWSFARKSVLMAEVANAYPDVWAYAYDLPTDGLTYRRVCEAGQMPNWNTSPPDMYVESGFVFTNVYQARMFYTRDSEETATWSSLFDDALAFGLAYRLAPKMTRKKSDVADLKAQYEDAISLAIEHDSAQEVTSYRWGDGYADARQGGSGYPDGLPYDGSRFWGGNR